MVYFSAARMLHATAMRPGANSASPERCEGAMVRVVEALTRVCGTGDTFCRSRLFLAAVISLVLHILPFPAHLLHAVFGLWLARNQPMVDDTDQPTIIPIELEEQEAPEPPQASLAPEINEPEARSKAKRGPADAGADALDGGVDGDASGTADGSDAGPASEPDAAAARSARDLRVSSRLSTPKATIGASEYLAAAADGGIEDAAADARPFAPVGDPVALAGQAGRIAGVPNVSLIFYPEKIRQHPLGKQFGPILARIPQWRSFFGGTQIDPIQDADRILLAGPQFRDSSRMVAVIRFRGLDARIRSAVRVVVDRSGDRGGWLDAGAFAARAFADRADRVIVMPAPSILAVVPPDGLDQALRVRSIPAGKRNQILVGYMRTPRNAFRGFPIDIPATLDGLRFSIDVTADGGADVRIDVKDKDAATASADATRLAEDLDRVSFVSLAFSRLRLFDPVSLRAEGDRIRGEAHLTEQQLKTILSLVATQVDMMNPGPGTAAQPK